MRVRLAVAVFGLIAALVLPAHLGSPVPASGALGVGVTYKAGWNLVGGPDGTVFGAAGNAYTLVAGDGGYESAPASAPVAAGKGYWMYFPTGTTVTLNGAGISSTQQSLPPGQFVMVGNPSGVQAVTLSGADEVLAYDPANGYTTVTQLAVGQGAWALSDQGGTLTMTAMGPPLPIPTATPTSSPSPSPASPASSPSRTFNVPQDCRGSVTVFPATIHNVAQTLTVSITSSFPNEPFGILFIATPEGGGTTDGQGGFSGTIPFTPITLTILPGASIVGPIPVVAVFPNGCVAGTVTIQP